MDGVLEVRTAVGARQTIVSYDSTRIEPDAIRTAIRGLGMTVVESPSAARPRRRAVWDSLGWLFVSAVAVVALLEIIGERLGVVDAVAERVPPWLATAL
jgi:hypothetical protein